METIKINSVSIQGLFGQYDYYIERPLDNRENLTILYGNNGAGKSTILRIIYFLLSSKRNAGHKTALANIPFKSIEIELSDETKVSAFRSEKGPVEKGSFDFCFSNNKDTIKVAFRAVWRDEQYSIRVDDEHGDESLKTDYEKILLYLQKYKILFISDNRKEIDQEELDDDEIGYVTLRAKADKYSISRGDAVAEEVKRLQNWIISQALTASQRGEENSSDLYSHILDSIIKPKRTDKKIDINNIKKEIDEITAKSTLFVNMGFMIDPEYKNIADRLVKINSSNDEIVAKLIYPYIEIQKNKLNALSLLVQKVFFFISSLNDYLYDKYITYSVGNGFEIRHKGNDEIVNFCNLSSGERQLLLLLCKVMRQSSTSSLIIIDEPEISLNIKWQRKLMETMLKFTQDTSAHILIATHSIEILAKHRRSLVHLDNISKNHLFITEYGRNNHNL